MLKKILSILRPKADSSRTGPTDPPEPSPLNQHESEDDLLFAQLRDRLTPPDAERFGGTATSGDIVADIRTWLEPVKTVAQSQDIAFTLTQNQARWLAHYDASIVQTIVTNLTSNAVKFTNSGGEVTVEAAYETAGLTLRINDTGIGIASENRPALFGQTNQTGSAIADSSEPTGTQEYTEGSLAQTRELVARLAGTIGVASVVGTGTTLTIWLPMHSETTPVPEPEESAKIM